MQPTEEQLEALQKFKTGKPLKISAFAGAGKTTTLTMLAKSRTSKGLYLAFNRAIAAESKSKFPAHVDCRTTHSLAYQSVMNSHRFSSGQMSERIRPRQLVDLLELKRKIFQDKFRLEGVQQAFLTLRTIQRFCQSDSATISENHVPQYGRLMGLSDDLAGEVRAWAVQSARDVWSRMINPRNGDYPVGFDGFLKLWALGNPKIAADFIMLDEAQDTNPAVLSVLRSQDAQLVYVGDKHQQIYEWRGAINAMGAINNCDEAYLTQSFRFGAAIADPASRILATLGETKSLEGTPWITSSITSDGDAATILSRTNATVIRETLTALNAGKRPHIVGGVAELKQMIRDVYSLKRGEPAASPEFFGFTNWQEVIDFSESEEGEELRMFVQLVEQQGEGRLWWAVTNVESTESDAGLIISTAHKAKGREWEAVRLSEDFLSSRIQADNPEVESEVRLFYVAMTRAKQNLIVDPAMLNTFTEGTWKSRQLAEKQVTRSANKPKIVEKPSPTAATPNDPRPTLRWRELVESVPVDERRTSPSQRETASGPPSSKDMEIASSLPPLVIPKLHPKPAKGVWGRISKLFGK